MGALGKHSLTLLSIVQFLGLSADLRPEKSCREALRIIARFTDHRYDLDLEVTASHAFYHSLRVRPFWDIVGELMARIIPNM